MQTQMTFHAWWQSLIQDSPLRYPRDTTPIDQAVWIGTDAAVTIAPVDQGIMGALSSALPESYLLVTRQGQPDCYGTAEEVEALVGAETMGLAVFWRDVRPLEEGC